MTKYVDDIDGSFEVLAFGADVEGAYAEVADRIGSTFALRKVTVPDGMPFGEFVALARAEQRLNDPWNRLPNRKQARAEHERRLAALPPAWQAAVRHGARFDRDVEVCCYVALDDEASELERQLAGAPEGHRAFVFFGRCR